MAKIVSVTRAGGTLFDDGDVSVSINADNINICEPVREGEEVGATKITFNDGTTIHVTETMEELKRIINA